jgi:hypothetical protein
MTRQDLNFSKITAAPSSEKGAVTSRSGYSNYGKRLMKIPTQINNPFETRGGIISFYCSNRPE